MKQNYLGNGKTNLFAILANTSLVGHAKTLFVLLCLQFVCVAASAASNPFTIFATYFAENQEIRVDYINLDGGTAIIQLFKYGDHYSKGANAPSLNTRTVKNTAGTVWFSTSELSSDAYVVNITKKRGETGKTTSYFVVNNEIGSISINNYAARQYATITFSPSNSTLSVKKNSNSQVVSTATTSPYNLNYANMAGGDYTLSVSRNGNVYKTASFAVHKLTGISSNSSYVTVTYNKGTSSKGGYTVMRLASATTGNIFCEQAVGHDEEYSGSVSIYRQGPQFKTDTYVVSFVVDGVVQDSKKIGLAYY